MPYLSLTTTHTARTMTAAEQAVQGFAGTLELAKNSVSTRLAAAPSLSFDQKVLVQRICESVLDGDLSRLQRALADLGNHDDKKELIIAAVAMELRSPGVTILPLQQARWRFTYSEDPSWLAILSIHLLRAQRVLVMATDERFGSHVFSRESNTGVTKELLEDPRILLRQIGRLIASELTSGPPPFCAG